MEVKDCSVVVREEQPPDIIEDPSIMMDGACFWNGQTGHFHMNAYFQRYLSKKMKKLQFIDLSQCTSPFYPS